MKSYLKINKKISFLFFLFLAASCSQLTSRYQVIKTHIGSDGKIGGVELLSTPDRINMECEDVSDENDLYGFMIHVVDTNGEYITLTQTNTLEQDDCHNRIKKIDKILKKGTNIYMFGMGRFDSNPEMNIYNFVFKNFGKRRDSGKSLQFLVIKNEVGDCFGAYTGTEECPVVGIDFFPGNIPAKWNN